MQRFEEKKILDKKKKKCRIIPEYIFLKLTLFEEKFSKLKNLYSICHIKILPRKTDNLTIIWHKKRTINPKMHRHETFETVSTVLQRKHSMAIKQVNPFQLSRCLIPV